MVFLRQRFVRCNQIMFNLSNTRRLRKTGAIMHIKILSFILNLDLPFYAQFENPSMILCVVINPAPNSETLQIPKSSPNNHLVDHENYHFINPEKPGDPIVPYSSPKHFPSSSPKNRFVDYLSS